MNDSRIVQVSDAFALTPEGQHAMDQLQMAQDELDRLVPRMCKELLEREVLDFVLGINRSTKV